MNFFSVSFCFEFARKRTFQVKITFCFVSINLYFAIIYECTGSSTSKQTFSRKFKWRLPICVPLLFNLLNGYILNCANSCPIIAEKKNCLSQSWHFSVCSFVCIFFLIRTHHFSVVKWTWKTSNVFSSSLMNALSLN